ncbi:ribosome hibernation-promoting factor, HPF/YfiA family [Rickettsiales endosymbiont of Stachyamoeba lipophora]|uniref:ribosome hibernation-promoting factor, HPF/YfiA family n=1 Tax=Rickettsiales endosymbiont of Stachyamoeba lipophora TaxID=2486578 RepID=UPI000F64FAFE|nr:ribosome-associated translation inhibitor RaiA [Rickettsiales endosymbiont of Stachyamoeba lipophora]AZL15331.1 ribosome-associated translation inhibitor RaiA [Rickettsiales endosymbiont of Stachyamoeba lipophora]
MKILISGKQVNLGQSLQQYAHERTERSVSKFFERAIQAEIHFNREGAMFECDITVNEGTGQHRYSTAQAQSDDIYTAFDTALVKIEKQLRKYKSKLKDHHKVVPLHDLPVNEAKLLSGTKYILEPFNLEDEKESKNDNPIIIAEKVTNIEYLTVSEAVMKMDLMHVPALIFWNKGNERLNIVYYRHDGNIAWIDPSEKNQ